MLICSCRVVQELLIVRISSAWMKPPAYVSPTNRPRPLLCRDCKRGSLISRKSTGERTEPGRTPHCNVNGEESTPFTLTMLFGDVFWKKWMKAMPICPLWTVWRWMQNQMVLPTCDSSSITSVFESLHSPVPSALARKRKLCTNPPSGLKKGKGG